MKILLAEAVTKVDKLEQNRNNCKNCRSSTHTTLKSSQLYKVCQGSLRVHVFWKYSNFTKINFGNSSTTVAIDIKPVAPYILLEDNENFDIFTNPLEDFFAHKETQPRKRVRVKGIEDKDNSIRFISTNISNITSTTCKSANKKPTKLRKSRSSRDLLLNPSPANKAGAWLMGEAKLSLPWQQICDLALSFKVKVRKLLVKPRKPIGCTKIRIENILFSNTNGDDSKNCT